MLYDYLISNFKDGEPILLSELPGRSRDSVRQEMKKLTDEGKLERLYNGVYYLAYYTRLGEKGRVSFDRFLEKKYLFIDGTASGYVTGLQLAHQCGFTAQIPSCYEICSNAATTKQRKLEIDGKQVILYKPAASVTEKNLKALQFLDLMAVIDRYADLAEESAREKLREYADSVSLDFREVKKYLGLYPDRVYRNLYEGGLMREVL